MGDLPVLHAQTLLTGRGFAAPARALLLAGAVLAGASACTPDDDVPVLSVKLVDGTPTVLLEPCGDARVWSLSVYPDGPATDLKWHADGEGADATEISLFDGAAGWTVDQRTLTELAPGTRYAVSGGLTDSRSTATVRFTLEQLRGLAGGEVVTAESGSSSEEDFRAAARDAC